MAYYSPSGAQGGAEPGSWFVGGRITRRMMRDSDAQAAQTGEDESISRASLFVDLDQSLLRTDLLWEGLVTLLR